MDCMLLALDTMLYRAALSGRVDVTKIIKNEEFLYITDE
jgi:hypothetical protein